MKNGNGKKQYRVVTPIRREGKEDPFWMRLGTAWENPGKDGKAPSISVRLDAMPVSRDPNKGAELVLFVDDGKGGSEEEAF